MDTFIKINNDYIINASDIRHISKTSGMCFDIYIFYKSDSDETPYNLVFTTREERDKVFEELSEKLCCLQIKIKREEDVNK